jgi:hypothetical protein
VAATVSAAAVVQRLAPVYHRKYKPWKLDPEMGPIFEVRPRIVFAMYETRFKDATRYSFDTNRRAATSGGSRTMARQEG